MKKEAQPKKEKINSNKLLELHETREKYRILVENLNVGIWQIDKDANTTFVNSIMADMLGYTAEEMLGKHLFSFMDEQGTVIAKQNIERRQQGIKEQHDFEFLRKDGTRIFTSLETSPLINENGDYIGAIAGIIDITGRKQAEKKLYESEERYRQLIDLSPYSIIVHKEGIIIFVNSSAIKNWGKGRDIGFIGRPVYDFIQKEFHLLMKQRIKQLSTGEVLPPVKITGHDIKGNQAYIEVISRSIIFDESPAIMTIFRDITEQTVLEHDKAELENRLHHAQKMEAVGLLAGGVAHDLNNILGGLVSYPELLLRELPEDSLLRYPAQTILKAGKNAAAIVKDLLALARRGVTVNEVVNLNEIINNYVKSQDHIQLLDIHPYINILISYEKDLLNIIGSPYHLEKIIMNLVENAASAMSAGGTIRIKTVNRYFDKPFKCYGSVIEGDYAVLSVTDTGKELSEKDYNRIFEPFYTKAIMGRSGTGLGLAAAWGIVEDHKGHFDVKSYPDKGTTFSIYFPITREEITKPKSTRLIKNYMGKGETILVVDDVELQREITSVMLSNLGYKVDSAASGEEAVEYMKTHGADIIILDMIMVPGIDGLETYKRILEFKPEQKAVIVSGYSETSQVNDAQALGAGPYILKPFILEKLGLAIREELDK